MLKKIIHRLNDSPVWLIAILLSVIAVIFFLYLPFQIDITPGHELRKLYYVDHISEAHFKIIEKFNDKYKNQIEVIPVNLPFKNFTTNDRKAILTRSLRNRSDGLDIFSVDLIWVPRFAKWGYELDKRFKKETLDNVNNIALDACYHEGKLVAFPLFLDMGVMYYRKDIINKLPDGDKIEQQILNSMTWDQFIRLGKRMRNIDNPYYIFPGGNFEGMICCYNENISIEDSKTIFYNKPIQLEHPSSRRSLKNMVDMIHKYRFSPPGVTEFDETSSYIYTTQNDAVFLRGWSGFHKQYREFLEDTTLVEKMALAPLPHFEGNKSSAVFGGWCLMISKFSKRKEEALKFIRFMFEPENQEILYNTGGYLPINTLVNKDSVFIKNHPEMKRLEKMLEWGKHRPFLQNYTRISEIMSKSFHKALKNEITVEEALSEASRQLNDDRVILK